MQTLLAEVKALVLEAEKIIDSVKRPEINEKGKNDFVTEVDIKVSEFLCEGLPKLLDGSKALSEEGAVVEPKEGYYWIIDPIDGTTNFIYGIPDFAISVGLVKDGKPVLGVVYAPKKGEMYCAAEGLGAFCNEQKISVCADSEISSTLVLSETNPYADRASAKYPFMNQAFFSDCIDCRITGSAALDCCYIACGRGGVLFAENLKPWDYAAGDIIIREAGGMITQWDGSETKFFGPSTILASNGILHEEARKRIETELINLHPGNVPAFTPATLAPDSDSPLRDKTMIFLGSSITLGMAALDNSFADFLAKKDGIKAVKEAISGTTLVNDAEDSYIPRMHTIDKDIKADLFMCQLSTNDFVQGKEPERIYAAIDEIIAYARETWKCPVMFYTNPKFDSPVYDEAVEQLKKIAEEKKIGVVDLWSDETFNEISDEKRNLYMFDAVHPTMAGYREWWLPKMEREIAAYLE